ncbi:U1 snRNP-associated protein [Cyphellophora attinorum]|uniref:U1 snRNP-associated protein n=1 Tax=Cyphellophora attinorum TaxID=1664694 RepID=A0A0N1HVX2_9EURO|nr:U1 snRNP-associated protein [Phialophora attinorum]KPI44127.1 U1 snRNP-associated protein [Phialophora attinorum]
MYNPYQAPGSYAPPGGYGGFPGAPGMAPPPGMAAPGTGAPPGMQQAETPTDGRGGFPPNFQPPANMPNINFSAPVIRLGTSQPAKSSLLDGREDRGGRRAGLGSGTDGRQDRGGLTPVQPQTREEVIKTVFIGGITEGCGGDEGIERILRSAGNLKRWVRAMDAQDKPCKFGFAEYEDPESLNTAIETLRDVRVPVKRQVPKETVKQENGIKKEEENGIKKEEEEGEQDENHVEKSLLLVVADENSRAYIEQYEENIGGVDEDSRQMRLDHARTALNAVLNDLAHPSVDQPKDEMSGLDRDGDVDMSNGVDANGEAIITIPISADDELSDIPAEMRETVAKEIASFRDRSNRRDLERLQREEEFERQERNRSSINGSGRPSRLGSPPPSSAPSGPGGANGIPSGPRDRASGLNAPSGPKQMTGVQIPRDYQKGVTFVNGTGISTAANFDESDTDASDAELERRRTYLDQERRWLNRERSRTAAVEREKARDEEEASKLEEEKQAMAARLREFDDEKEAVRGADDYYADHSAWMRKRSAFRERERMHDEADRAAERREREWENRQQRDRSGRDSSDAYANSMDRDRGDRDDYDRSRQHPDRRHDNGDLIDDRRRPEPPSATTPTAPTQPARFKLSLGAAAQRQATEKEKNKRTVAEVEGLLDDSEATESTKRELVKIDLGPVPTGPSADSEGASMTPEQRAAAAKALAQEIPNDKEGLWAWEVKWEFLDEEGVIEERLKPFVEKKIVEYLGVQEQMLVDVVVEGLRGRKGAGELVGELEGALDEEAEQLVKKLWRMVIFFSESEKRGLSA